MINTAKPTVTYCLTFDNFTIEYPMDDPRPNKQISAHEALTHYRNKTADVDYRTWSAALYRVEGVTKK